MISIKNFKMPKDCHVCPCSIWGYDLCTCRLTGEHFPKPEKRHRNCPLKECGCDICKFKYRCTRRPDGHAIIFNCFKFKREDENDERTSEG